MRVHDSQANKKMDVTRKHIGRILELRKIILSFEIGFNLVSTAVICAVLESMSGLEPSSVTNEPLDEDKVPLLSLLDLSAAFDTTDHSIFLSCLSYSSSVSGTVLAWLTSCLSYRTKTVSVNESKSLSAALQYGVFQGSVLGTSSLFLQSSPF